MANHFHRAVLLLLIGVTSIASGCDETVNPIVGEERPVTVFGYLDPTSDRQILRLIPITASIQELERQNVDADVQTIHESTGAVQTWSPVSVAYSDSSVGTVYEAFFTPEYAQTYRLEILSREGSLTHAVTTIPPELEITQDTDGNPLRPGFFIPGELPNLVQMDMVYEVMAMQPVVSTAENVLLPIRISYKDTQLPADGGWRLAADLRDDFDLIGDELRTFCITTPFIALRSSAFVFFVGDAAWVPPGASFDPALIAQPGVFSNVENGYGYFGSGYEKKFQFRLSESARVQLGFALEGPCQDGPADPQNPEPECLVFEPCL